VPPHASHAVVIVLQGANVENDGEAWIEVRAAIHGNQYWILACRVANVPGGFIEGVIEAIFPSPSVGYRILGIPAIRSRAHGGSGRLTRPLPMVVGGTYAPLALST
jgi:hypothetical protein